MEQLLLLLRKALVPLRPSRLDAGTESEEEEAESGVMVCMLLSGLSSCSLESCCPAAGDGGRSSAGESAFALAIACGTSSFPEATFDILVVSLRGACGCRS